MVSDKKYKFNYFQNIKDRRLNFVLLIRMLYASIKRFAIFVFFFRIFWRPLAIDRSALVEARLRFANDSSPSPPNRRSFTPPCRRWSFLTNDNRRRDARAGFAAKKISRENWRSLFRCGSAGTITTVSGYIWVWTGILQMFWAFCK